ncbi:MAG: hypothetical protein IJO09_05120 [Oscillospiraceae bacterium]|nr:hypothetical protein [Oscillospiraceae bacterium]
MLMQENNYEFKKRLLTVHKEGVRDFALSPTENDYIIHNGFSIVLPKSFGDVISTAASDFLDYLFTSMDISAMLVKEVGNLSANAAILTISETLNEDYVITFGDVITVCGKNERAVAQALYCLEDKMNFRRAPFIEKNEIRHTFMFSPRMVHPGYGVDEFPNEHLAAIAHAGMDAVLVFTTGVNETPSGFLDFNELVYRAGKYGIDVYAYSYMPCSAHPDDADAREKYDSLYGEVFKNCPGLRGIVLVGEIVGFESKDPRTHFRDLYDREAFPSDKPHPGFWPCCDYPDWLECIKKSVYKYNKDADIVFWSYNWGSAPTEERLKLIKNLPTDVSLLVTYEMYETCRRGKIKEVCSDYTLSFAGPGHYFTSEAEAAKKRGLRLYAMSNTGGQTWDMGLIPYEPMPYQWIKRYKGLRKAHEEWGLCGLMDSHHYGFWPSFIGDLSKQAFIKEKDDLEKSLSEVLSSRFGAKSVSTVDAALRKWSEAIEYFIPGDDDQYGPFRVGPSYPFCLVRMRKPPSNKYAHFGNNILNINYPAGNTMGATRVTGRGMLSSLRIGEEIKSLHMMRNLMEEGVALLETIPENDRNKELSYLINLGKYICCYVRTGIGAKEWFRIKNKLLSVETREDVAPLIEKARNLLLEERANAEAAIEFVRLDSRLGWEPSMDYLGDEKSIRWKIDFIDYVLNSELPSFENASASHWQTE